jgi:hypothetical protein
MGDKRGVYRVLVEKPDRRRPLGRHWRRWKDNMKTNLRDVRRGGMDWIELAQDRDRCLALVNAVIKQRVL